MSKEDDFEFEDIDWGEEMDLTESEPEKPDNGRDELRQLAAESPDDEKKKSEDFFRRAISSSMAEELRSLTASIGPAEKKRIVGSFCNELLYLSSAHPAPGYHISQIVLVGLLQLPVMRQAFSICFNGRPPNLIFETEALLAVRRQLQQTVTRKPPGDQDKHSWYEFQEVENRKNMLDVFRHVATDFEENLRRDRLDIFFGKTFGTLAGIEPSPILLTWWQGNLSPLNYEVFLSRSRSLKRCLGKVVKGQSQAIDALCDGYAQSTLRAKSGPRGIFMLMGESGTGKTLLAESFADEISELEGEEFDFLRFDMQQFTDKRASAALFGSANFYSNATLGELTDNVRNYPKTVILFDEIEKAHSSVIQSLLALLDRGVCQDDASLKWVDFSQTFILFTTNLGSQKLADRRNSSQVLGTLDNMTLGSLLQRQPEAGPESGLSPEFINRLSKGRFLVFEPLQPEQLLGVYASVWNDCRKSVQAQSVEVPECSTALATLQLMRRLPDLSARTAASAAEADVVDCLKSMIEAAPAGLNNDSFDQPPLARLAGIETLIEDMLGERGLNAPPHLLVIDDDEQTRDLIAQHVDGNVVVDPLNEANADHRPDQRTSEKFDLVVIDLFIGNDDSQIKTSHALNRILELRGQMPDVPIIAFCKNPKNTLATSNAVKAAKAIKGVSQVVTYKSEDSAALIQAVITHLEASKSGKLVRSFNRERKRLLFTWRVTETEESMTISPAMVRVEPVLTPGAEGKMFGLGEIPDLNLANVVGNERGVQQISNALGWLKNPGRVRKFGFRPPAGYLLAGPPGTGKTFLARAAAGECGLPFFSINGAELLSPRIGAAEATLRRLFQNARQLAPAVIFIDEIDAIASKRGSSDAHQGIMNTLLSEMDGFGGHDRPVLVLAATNFPEVLDSALKRPGRLDEVIVCDLPNAPARKHLFGLAAEKLQLVLGDEAMDQLVTRTQGESAAAIEAASRQAAYLADNEDRDPSVADLEQAVYQLVYGTVREDLLLAKEEKWSVACHEAGHALAIHYLFPGRRIDYITIQPRTGSLGFVAHSEGSPGQSGGLAMTRAEIEGHVAVALAGREAERLMLGKKGMSAGAGSDLSRANGLVKRAVMSWGLDEQVGPMALEPSDLHADPALASLCTARCREWLAECEERSRGLLGAHLFELENLARALFQRESLNQEEVRTLLPEIAEWSTT